jgi:tRNA nucleotidyltransferase (CCA-adding enzyme)
LGLPPKEQDWLVMDTSGQELEQLGFRRVGRDFPVYLHPDTSEEHALPRAGDSSAGERERVYADLAHRDLTINAMALSPEGELLDPLHGQQDLEQRQLRHTPAFQEDPLRVLRLARLYARYHHLGFHIAPETLALVKHMVDEGCLNALVPERVWAEILTALTGASPSRFFEALRSCHALTALLPELERLFGVPQPPKHHPEIDCGIHSLMVLDQACRLSDSPEVRFAALLHDLGKAETPAQRWPQHIGHEKRSARLAERVCLRLKAPTRFRELACLVAEFHTHAHRTFELKPATLLKLFKALDCFRRSDRLEPFLLTCEADARGRSGFEQRPYPQAGVLKQLYQAAKDVDTRAAAVGKEGTEIARAIDQARLHAIRHAKKELDISRT